jgi:hypothetical protein
MPNLDKIYLWRGQVIYHGNDGMPYVPAELPAAVFATYASNEGELPVAIAAHHSGGATANKRLFLIQREGSDGARTGLLYTWEADCQINVVERPGPVHHNHVASAFTVVREGGGYTWEHDLAAGKPGIIVTGSAGYGSMFRLQRIESDAFGRAIVTIVPVKSVSAVPGLSFATVRDGALRQEAEEHYRELQAAFRTASSRGLAKHIVSLVEACLTDRLRSVGVASTRNLAAMLEEVERRIADGSKDILKDAGYHSAQSIRLAYQRTHPEAAARTNTPIEPEEALCLLQDLKRVMSDLGFLA